MKNLFKKSDKPTLWNDINKANFGVVMIIILFVIAMLLTT